MENMYFAGTDGNPETRSPAGTNGTPPVAPNDSLLHFALPKNIFFSSKTNRFSYGIGAAIEQSVYR